MEEVLTFKPLARGRFRCNVKNCGAVVKQRRLNTHRGVHKSRSVATELPVPMLKANIWYGLVRCPHCGWSSFTEEAGTVVCISCREKFTAV